MTLTHDHRKSSPKLGLMVMWGRETIKNIKETLNKSPGVVSRRFWTFKNLETGGKVISDAVYRDHCPYLADFTKLQKVIDFDLKTI